MNRKRIKRLILNCITVACVTSTPGLMNASYAFADNKKSEVTRSEALFKNSELLNDSFDKVIKEENNTYKTWWKDETRSSDWQLRKWTGAVAIGNDTPIWGGCLR